MQPGGPRSEATDPARIAHFRILGRIGRGGMGVVYRAEDESLRRTVALKLLPDTGNQEKRRRFVREARSAAAVTHPNVAAIHQIGEGDGRVYIAMELVDGENLRARMDRGPLDLATARDLAGQIAGGLAAAHDKGIVHRDLKPENVMITPAGVVKLLDFGLAKSALELAVRTPSDLEGADTERFETTDAGNIRGTPDYMSPEQALGEKVDVRSDVFSFGILFYEMLCGTRPFGPFNGANTSATLISIARDPAPPIRDRARGVDEDTAAVVMRCLAKAPVDRYASASEIAAALGVRRAPTQPPTPMPTPMPPRPATRAESEALTLSSPEHPPTVPPPRGKPWIAGVALAAVVLGAGAWWSVSRAPTPPAPVATASAPAPTASQISARIADHPSSHSAVPAAEASYRRGMEMIAHGEATAFRAELESAVAADPDFAAAHLQLLLNDTYYCPTNLADARPHFMVAKRMKQTLAAADQELLDALEPTILDPPDLAEAAARMRALTERRPDDPQVWDALSAAENKLFHFQASAAAAERATTVDTSEMLAVAFVAWAQDIEPPRQDGVIDACLQRSSTAEWCRIERAKERALTGACSALEKEARSLSALVPEAPSGPAFLALALAGEGAPAEAVSVALADQRTKVPAASRARDELVDRANLALWSGDFAAGLQGLDQAAQLRPAPTLTMARVEALWESGQRRAAADLALDYIKKAAALPRFERPEGDPMPQMLARAHAGGAMPDADFLAQRDAWFASWRARLDDEAWKTAGPVVWAMAFAYPSSPEDARAAVLRLSSIGPPPPIANRQFWTNDGPIGELLQAGGRLDDALPRLQAEAGRCTYDMSRVQAQLGLGQALEARGDKPGACASYAQVLARWGRAKPRSVTADEARARSRALGCAP
jgi:serine/threonine-protein kinase